jgi:hypothetical protein
LNPSIALTAGRGDKWLEDEVITLKDAVQTHGGKNWGLIAALVPGRTKFSVRRNGLSWASKSEATVELAFPLGVDGAE